MRGQPVVFPEAVLARVWDRIDVRRADECWPWLLCTNNRGYGMVQWSVSGVKRGGLAHRAAWTSRHGEIPGALTIDHLCRTRICCNPAHLRLLTLSENSRRNGQSTRTVCPQGHEYTPANTYVSATTGHRHCAECQSEYLWRRREHELAGRRCVVCASAIPISRKRGAFYCSVKCCNASRSVNRSTG